MYEHQLHKNENDWHLCYICYFHKMKLLILIKAKYDESLENMLFAYAKTKAQIGTADQHLCFCYVDSTIPLFPELEISSV